MDWTKTKSILIIALIITNSILGLYLYSQKKQEAVRWNNESDALNEMKAVLKERAINLNDKIVFKDEKAVNIEVAYQVFDIEKEGDRFFKSHFTVDENILLSNQEKLEINDTLLIYENNGLEEKNLEIAETDASQTGKDYLESLGFWSENVYLSDINKDIRGYELIYKQRYKGKFIENSYMRLRIVNEGVQQFERKWFDIIKVDEEPVAIIPASKALFYLIGELYDEDPERRSEVNIQTVDLGYRLDTSIFSAHIYSGEVSPYWRIRTENGNEYYIKALE